MGCGVGDDDPKDPIDYEPIDTNPQKLVCSDAFKVTGTFTPGTPARPAQDPVDPTQPYTGCWPIGTWNFTVTVDPSDENILDLTGDGLPERCGRVAGTQAANFDAGYNFSVARVADPDEDYKDTYSVAGTMPDGVKTRWNNKYLYKVKVSEGGGGECEGGLELYSLDGKTYWNLHPSLTGTAIAGFGDFRVYQEPQN